jgi:hypothetical protein
MITALLATVVLAGGVGFFAALLLTSSKCDDAYRAGRRDAFADRIRWDDHEVERDAAPESTP